LRGETLYQVNCQSCHGLRGVGENHSPRTLRDRRYRRAPALDDSTHAWHHNDDALVKTILEGSPREPRMAAFKDVLAREDAVDIVAYMKSLWGPRALACQGARHMAKECRGPR
jgi:mono/diheme cytochrome c family protein